MNTPKDYNFRLITGANPTFAMDGRDGFSQIVAKITETCQEKVEVEKGKGNEVEKFKLNVRLKILVRMAQFESRGRAEIKSIREQLQKEAIYSEKDFQEAVMETISYLDIEL